MRLGHAFLEIDDDEQVSCDRGSAADFDRRGNFHPSGTEDAGAPARSGRGRTEADHQYAADRDGAAGLERAGDRGRGGTHLRGSAEEPGEPEREIRLIEV